MGTGNVFLNGGTWRRALLMADKNRFSSGKCDVIGDTPEDGR